MAWSVITSIDDLQALRGEWERLASLARSPTLDHDWVISCVEAFHAERDLRIVVTREQGVLTGVAPLVLDHSGRGCHVVQPGAARLYEPGGWLYSSDEALEELAGAVIGLRVPLLLHRVPRGSGAASALAALPRGRGITVVRSGSSSLAVDTTHAWKKYCSGLSRRTLRKFTDGLAAAERALGPALIEELEPRPVDVVPLLDLLAELESSGWKGHHGSSIAQRKDLAGFLQSYCRRAAERGGLRLTRLSFGSEVAAAEIAVDAYGRRWGLKIAYRETLAAYSPGLQLVHGSIRAACERGLSAYEFLGSAEDWQRRWRPETREYLAILVYPWSVRGLYGACLDGGAALRRRTTRRVAPVRDMADD